MGFAMAHYSMGFAMHCSKEKLPIVCSLSLEYVLALQPIDVKCYIVFRFSFWYGNLKEAKKKLKVSVVDKMSFQELLSLRATKSNNQEQEESRREDEGE